MRLNILSFWNIKRMFAIENVFNVSIWEPTDKLIGSDIWKILRKSMMRYLDKTFLYINKAFEILNLQYQNHYGNPSQHHQNSRKTAIKCMENYTYDTNRQLYTRYEMSHVSSKYHSLLHFAMIYTGSLNTSISSLSHAYCGGTHTPKINVSSSQDSMFPIERACSS